MPSTPNCRAAASPDHIDLGRVMRGVVRKLPYLVGGALVVGALTGGVLSTMAPKYLSQAQLRVRGTGASDAGGQPDKEAVGTHVRALTSTDLAMRMSKALHLTEHAEFNSALPPDDVFGRTLRMLGLGGSKAGETDEDRLMQAYFQNVRAYQVRDTRSIMVDCTTSNPGFSADCANKLAELYRDSLRVREVDENADLRAKLKPQVSRLLAEAAEADALVADFRSKANLFQGGLQAVQLKDQQLGELSAELTRVAAQRSEAEARAAAARDMAARGMAAANPDVQKSVLVPRMEEQRVGLERQIAELSATLLPGHPRMKQLYSELASLQSQIRAEVQKVVESLGNDAKIAATREEALRRRLDDMKRNVASAAPDTVKLAQLENDARTKRAELDRLQAQYEKASSAAGTGAGSVEIEIVSPAYPSNEKIFPKVGQMSAMAAFATFILGLAGTLTRGLMQDARTAPVPRAATVVPRDKLERTEPTLREQPTQRQPVKPAQNLLAPAAAAASLAVMAEGGRGFRILLSAPAAGTSTAPDAVALSRALADTGHRTLLLAWDGGGDAIANAAGIAAEPGCAEVLHGARALEDVIQQAAGSTLDVIAAGNGTAAGIDADTAAMVLDALDEMYDFIIVEAPHKVAAALFETLQGRFDAGVLIGDGAARASQNGTVSFLGFTVADFLVLTVAASSTGEPARRARARRQAAVV